MTVRSGTVGSPPHLKLYLSWPRGLLCLQLCFLLWLSSCVSCKVSCSVRGFLETEFHVSYPQGWASARRLGNCAHICLCKTNRSCASRRVWKDHVGFSIRRCAVCGADGGGCGAVRDAGRGAYCSGDPRAEFNIYFLNDQCVCCAQKDKIKYSTDF